MNKLLRWFLVLNLSGLLQLGVGGIARAAEYFVTKFGSNGNSCSAAQTPSAPALAKLTIAAGMACLSSGDTLTIFAGNYNESLQDPTLAAGTSSAYTTIRRNGTDAVRIRPTSGAFVLGMADSDYHHIKFDGIIFDGSLCTTCSHVIMLTWGGTGPSDATHDITFTNSEFLSTNATTSKTCIQTTGAGNGIIVSNSTVHHCGYGFYWATPGNGTVGSGGIIERTYVHDIFQFGLHLYSDFGNINDMLVQDNYFFNTATDPAFCSGAMILSGGARHVARRNIVNTVSPSGGCGSGIIVHYGATLTEVYNNSVYNANFDGIELSAGNSNTLVKNNISLGSGLQNINNLVGATVSSNITSGSATSFWTDPASGNFTLLSTASTAINSCVDVGLAFNGAAPDCGAFETFTYSNAEIGTVNTSTVVINFQSAHAPILPSSGCTGWSARVNSSNRSLTSCIRVGNAQMWLSLATPALSSDTVDFSYNASTGAVTDSALIANQFNQPMFSITQAAVTNNISGGSAEVWATEHFRCRVWPVAVTGNTAQDWLRAEDSNCFVRNDGGKIAIAFNISCNGADCTDVGFQFYFCTASTPCSPSTAITNSCASNVVCYNNTATATHGTQISSARLTNPEPSYVTGGVVAQDSSFPIPALVQNSASELQTMLETQAGLASDTYICVEPRKDGGGQITQNVSACIVMSAPGAYVGS